MSDVSFHGRAGLKLALLSGLILLLLLAFIGFRYKNTSPDLESLVSRIVKEEEILSRMRINLSKSADIEKSAVMAETDELSAALADQSQQTADAVERDRIELGRIILPSDEEKEKKLFNEFGSCWEDLRKIDKTLLQIAVENTNIKASTLSFTQGGKAMERFEKSLTDIIGDGSDGAHATRITRLACDALTAGLKAYNLHAPHIAASNDAVMDRIETEIGQSNKVVEESLKKLENLVSGKDMGSLREALSAYADFEKITAQVITLSRQNTNIKSFELSLGRKRKATIQCDEILAALQQVVHSRTFEATR